MTHQILLSSPREPSGVTWLINCFLELGIRCFRGSSNAMWEETSGRSSLRPREAQLQRWLPALGRHAKTGFAFRTDVEVLWHHDWPDWRHRGRTLYFVRDPRDALYSRYRRDDPDLSFHEYANTLDSYSLLDRADTWTLFTRCWLAKPGAIVCRFEDYKQDAAETLANALEALELAYSDRLIEHAVEFSSFQHARAAEQAYLRDHPDEANVVINRSGKVGASGDLEGADALIMPRFATRSSDLMARLGYLNEDDSANIDFSSHMDAVGWLRATPLRPSTSIGAQNPSQSAAEVAADSRMRALAFAEQLTPEFLVATGMEPNVTAALVCNLRDSFGADISALEATIAPGVASYYWELTKRCRDPRPLRHIALGDVGRRLGDRFGRYLRGQ
ncbi:MAG: hypothetical protein ACI9OJ_000106 [Myxococcota bacterium]|jgi:hypothetical protein